MNENFLEYPICDTDIWVCLCLSEFHHRVIKNHGKLVFADVVEQEIVKWEDGVGKYRFISTIFREYKKEGQILVINHEDHLSLGERKVLERTLKELRFSHGLRNVPHEKDKGEFVSALYADHFSIPFMKTNDNSFQEGGRGKKEFPDLEIKNWYDIVEEHGYDQEERIRVRKLVQEEQEIMGRLFEGHKEEKSKAEMIAKLVALKNNQRL
ncbi:hypothetical protein [Sporosarcina sp. E16_8]|uniref:hypothetical protein n=1 Tax=Sporosarcina sp. E16_8 TaxID=2789295 RepID=UPI001A9114E0|nr:hypothetical protein [Sporosarcina sp. E16_8]MBO0588413.1 hypothetical protein [Sporosarcina sp. E16_8]